MTTTFSVDVDGDGSELVVGTKLSGGIWTNVGSLESKPEELPEGVIPWSSPVFSGGPRE